MTRRVKAVFACGLAIAVFWYMLTAANSLMISHNNRRLRQSLTSLDAKAIAFNNVVPFGWDTVYTFDPYLSKAEMAEIIGFNSGALRETISEGMVQLVFIKGRSVVASVCGYPDRLGYAVHFVNWGGGFAKLSFADDAAFSVEKADGVVRLRHIAGDA